MESVVLALDSCVLDHAACIGLQTAHGTADVSVYFDDLLDARGFEEGGCDALLNSEDNAFGCGDLADVRINVMDGAVGDVRRWLWNLV